MLNTSPFCPTANISQNKVYAKERDVSELGFFFFYGNNNHHIFAFKQRGLLCNQRMRSHFPEPRSSAVLAYSPVALMDFHGTQQLPDGVESVGG